MATYPETVPPSTNAPQFQQQGYQPTNVPPSQQYGYPATVVVPVYQYAPSAEVQKIRDWLPWSIINIFVCCFVGGIIALVFSILCRSKKRENDLQGAKSMSTIALVVNIISTLIGIAIWIIIIVFIVRATQTVNNYGYYYG